MKNVAEIVLDYLRANDYDGLCNGGDECGCGIDDFAPCGECTLNCVPAYNRPELAPADLRPCEYYYTATPRTATLSDTERGKK